MANKDDDLERELRDHLNLEAEEQREGGLPPAEARYAARRVLGNTTLIKEAIREMTGWATFDRLRQDLRYGARLLWRSPGFSIIAILTLALGIGANTAIFSVVNALLLRQLPYADSDHLFRLWPTNSQNRLDASPTTSYPAFLDWKQQSHSFEQVEMYATRSANLIGSDQPEHLRTLRVSPGFLALLGMAPILGRNFLEDEIQPGKERVALLTEGLWRRRFGADPGILGKTVKLTDESFTIIGVLPAAFQFPPNGPAELVWPQTPDPSRTHGFVNVVARLKPDASLLQAQAELDAITRSIETQSPKENQGQGVRLLSLQASYVQDVRPLLLVFLSAVGFVLLIACANVANLFLGRASERQKELVVRAALGAGRLRLARQLLTESALIGIAAGALGLLFAIGGVQGLLALVQKNFPAQAHQAVSLDATVLLFTVVISLVVGVASGLAPALAASRLDLNDTLKEASRGLTANRRRNRLRSAFVVAEIALALVLLIGAGLMLKSFVVLENIDPGLHPENILTMDLSIRGRKYATTPARSAIVSEMTHRIEQIPGVQSAAVVTDIPLTHNEDTMGITIEGRPSTGAKKHSINFNIVGPGYLRTLGIPLFQGRDFSERDTLASPTIVLINRAMARRFWPDQDPMGARLSTDGQHWLTIAGIVGDVRQMGLRSEPLPEVYISYLQDPYAWPFLSLLVRTTREPKKLASSIKSVVWSVDKDMPIMEISTMEEIRAASIAQPRVSALLLTIFAALALVLASVGIYGVMSHSVSQRTHEMGLRMALGARAADVLTLVVGRGMILALSGVALGLGGAFALTRLLAGFLWTVQPADPLTFAAVSLLLAGVALLACYVPARRATKVDPIAALRYE